MQIQLPFELFEITQVAAFEEQAPIPWFFRSKKLQIYKDYLKQGTLSKGGYKIWNIHENF